MDGLGFSEFVFPLFSDAFLFFAGFSVGSLEFRNFTSILLLKCFALGAVDSLKAEVSEVECLSSE